MRMPRLFFLLAVALFAMSAGSRAQTATIALVLSDPTPAQQEFMDAFKAVMGRGEVAANTVVINSQDLDKLPASIRLLLPLGAKASDAALGLDSSLPTLVALLPRAHVERLQLKSPRRLSAVYLDQPSERQLNLLRLALPEHHRVGLLLGPESAGRGQPFASAKNLRLVSEYIAGDNELFPALQRVLADADLLLAVPDALIYNRQTLPNILLTTYQHKIPMVGFSPAYVRAGALLALYSTPTQMAEQSADLVKGVLAGRPLPPPQFPRDFSIGVNAHVARALGLSLPDETTLKTRLRQMEHQP